MSFDPISVILQNEGSAFTNYGADKGGPTKYGVTLAELTRWRDGHATIDDVKNLTEDEARQIYTQEYLVGPHINCLSNPPQTLVLDMCVNHGPRNAIKMAQRVVNMAGIAQIEEDGVLGPGRIAAINKAQQTMGPYYQNALVEERIKFYQRIVDSDPRESVFLKGWLARANSFLLPVK
jgi:lysozyme family protein